MSIVTGKEYLGDGREAHLTISSGSSIGGRLFIMSTVDHLSMTEDHFRVQMFKIFYGTDMLQALRDFAIYADKIQLDNFYIIDNNVSYFVRITKTTNIRDEITQEKKKQKRTPTVKDFLEK